MAAMSPEILEHPVYDQGLFGEKNRGFLESYGVFAELVNKYNPKVGYRTDIVATELVASRAFRDNNLWMHANAFGNYNMLKAPTSIAGDLAQLTGKNNPYPYSLGVIEPGAYADLILIEGNPLEDISVLGAKPKVFEGEPRTEEGFKNMKIIMKDGVIYKNTL